MLFNQSSILLAALTLGFVIPWSEPTCDCDPHYEDDPCRYDSDCYGGQVCDTRTYDCVEPEIPEPPDSGCEHDGDCHDGKVCKDRRALRRFARRRGAAPGHSEIRRLPAVPAADHLRRDACVGIESSGSRNPGLHGIAGIRRTWRLVRQLDFPGRQANLTDRCASVCRSVTLIVLSERILRLRSSVAQWQSIRLLTGGLLVRVQPEEPLAQLRFARGPRAGLSGAAFGFAYHYGRDWSWFAGAFIACSLLHFWYDSFVWSVRKKQV